MGIKHHTALNACCVQNGLIEFGVSHHGHMHAFVIYAKGSEGEGGQRLATCACLPELTCQRNQHLPAFYQESVSETAAGSGASQNRVQISRLAVWLGTTVAL